MTIISLYRGSEEIIAELEVNQETGEIGTDVPIESLALRNPIGIAAFILNCESTADMLQAHINLIAEKRQRILNSAGRAHDALQSAMSITGTKSIASTDGTFKATLYKERDVSVEVFDERQIPQDYMKEIPATYRPDKRLIKKALDDGFDVVGAKIVKKDRLKIG